MADPPRPSDVEADEYGNVPRARHLRIDERPAVRDLDDAQLAAEALTALRAEHRSPPEPERVGIVPWDPPSFSTAAATPDAASGRHRANDRPSAAPPGTRVAAAGRRTAGAPEAGPAKPAPSSRDDHVLVTARAGLRPPGVSASASRRSWRSRPLLMAVAVAILAGLGVLAFVLVRAAGDAVPPAGGPAVSVGTTAPTADASAPAVPAVRTSPSTGAAAAPAPAATDPSASSESSGSARAAAAVSPTPDADRTIPAPAVLSTLAPGDAGFGWPSTAFGQPR